MTNITELNDNNFDTFIKSTEKPIIIDFYAPWCGHCRTQESIIEQFAEEFKDISQIAKINVDDNHKKATEFFISGIPALLVFKNGKLMEQKSGVHSMNDLKKLIEKYR